MFHSENYGLAMPSGSPLRKQIDQSLLGGAVLKAGDLVIDGSIKGRLERLATDLTA